MDANVRICRTPEPAAECGEMRAALSSPRPLHRAAALYDAAMIWPWFLAGLAAGGAIAALAALLLRSRLSADLAGHRARADLLDGQLRERLAEMDQVRSELSAESRSREAAERRAAVAEEQIRACRRQFDDQQRLLEDAEKRLTTTFEAAGARALRTNSEQFVELAKTTFEAVLVEARGDVEKKQQAIDTLVRPIRELLEKHHASLGEIERKREVAYRGIEEQIRAFASLNEGLRRETGNLVAALRRPEQRGRWGEVQLRNCVELAGMTEHCDYSEQVASDDGEGRQRPDMVVRLPGGGTIVVDAKCALDAYLDALDPQRDRAECLGRHALQMEKQVRGLAAKEYWKQFERTPRVVVMFVPLESALTAALEINPGLHADAMARDVLIATPVLLVALLRAVAYGWQQEDVAANARAIATVGRELYDRLGGLADKLSALGGRLDSAVGAYNGAIASLEARVLPSARRLRDFHATTEAEITMPEPLQVEVRPIVAAELKALGDASRDQREAPDAAPASVPRIAEL
jgi:DNA recombination protein RmuC